eukprot:gene8534-17601_t
MKKFLLTTTLIFSSIPYSFCFHSFHWNKSDENLENWHILNGPVHVNNGAIKAPLRDKRLVLIGDSLTRYQYLNLIHFMYTNTWFSPHPFNEVESQWNRNGSNGWAKFFKGTSIRFGCFEICDCEVLAGKKAYENRHYHDPKYNISIHYFGWWPPGFINGSLNIPLSTEYYENCIYEKSLKNNNNSQFAYIYNDIVPFLDEIIRPLSPHAVIINQGIWPDLTLREPQNFHKFAQILSEITPLPIWKTTTAILNSNPDKTAKKQCHYGSGERIAFVKGVFP